MYNVKYQYSKPFQDFSEWGLISCWWDWRKEEEMIGTRTTKIAIRAANLVRPKKGTMMAKKGISSKNKEFITMKLTTTRDTLPMQKCPFLMLFFFHTSRYFFLVILVLSAFHIFWEHFSLQVCFKVCFKLSFLLNLWSNQHFRAVVWHAVCFKKRNKKRKCFMKKKRTTVIWRKKRE